MSRKLIALAATGVLCAPLFAKADLANINLYGTLNMDLETAKATDAIAGTGNVPSRFRLSSNSSNFGIKGSEDLGMGLKGIFQIENAVNLANGTGTLAGRNSAVGLSGGFGSVMVGNWDTPFKALTMGIDPFYATGVGNVVALLDNGGVSNAVDVSSVGPVGTAADHAGFHCRQGNNIQYWSPAVMGTMLKVMYSTNTNRTAAANPYLVSASLGYDEGPLMAGISYEMHKDEFAGISNPLGLGTGTSSTDTGIKAMLGYRLMEATTLGAAFSSLKYKATLAAGDNSYSRAGWVFTATHKIGEFTLRAGYGFTTNGSYNFASGTAPDSAGLGAKQMVAGGSYSLSKRTDLYAVFSRIANNKGAYNFAYNPVSGVSAGADPQVIGLGVRHVF